MAPGSTFGVGGKRIGMDIRRQRDQASCCGVNLTFAGAEVWVLVLFFGFGGGIQNGPGGVLWSESRPA
jgi:hypothetical protein